MSRSALTGFETSRDKNSLWYMFEEAARDGKGADCLVCEGLTLSWDQVYRREYRSVCASSTRSLTRSSGSLTRRRQPTRKLAPRPRTTARRDDRRLYAKQARVPNSLAGLPRHRRVRIFPSEDCSRLLESD